MQNAGMLLCIYTWRSEYPSEDCGPANLAMLRWAIGSVGHCLYMQTAVDHQRDFRWRPCAVQFFTPSKDSCSSKVLVKVFQLVVCRAAKTRQQSPQHSATKTLPMLSHGASISKPNISPGLAAQNFTWNCAGIATLAPGFSQVHNLPDDRDMRGISRRPTHGSPDFHAIWMFMQCISSNL